MSERATNPGRRDSALDSEIECLRELGGRLGIGESLRTGFRDHDHIRGRTDIALPVAERLAQETLDPIPDDRVTDALAHRHAQARARAVALPADDDQMRGVAPPSIPLQAQVLSAAPKPGRLRIAQRLDHDLTRAASAGWSRSGVCGPCSAVASTPAVPQDWPCAPETRAFVCGGGCSADRSSSSLVNLRCGNSAYEHTPCAKSIFRYSWCCRLLPKWRHSGGKASH
jgi:hypothetical protein